MRGEYPRPPATALVWIFSAILATFLLQLVLLSPWIGSSSALPDLLRLTVRNIEQGRVWTLLTHGFLHSTGNPLHIVFSLLGLVLIGRELEPHLGARRFALLFAGALLTGAATWLALHWRAGGVHIGPSAAILGLLVVLARLYEKQQLSFMPFFLFSVTLRPMHLVYGLAAIDTLLLILYEVTGSPVPFGYAPSAHLGGLLAGWVYFRFFHANNGWDRAPSFRLPAWLRFERKPAPPAAPPPSPPRTHRDTESLRADVDRILDKINSQGFASLTPEEKNTLDEAKALMSKR